MLTVSIKLQDFYTKDPEAWFTCPEAQFGICSVTQNETRFWYVLTSLDAETSTHTNRIVHDAKTGSKYQCLKEHLIPLLLRT